MSKSTHIVNDFLITNTIGINNKSLVRLPLSNEIYRYIEEVQYMIRANNNACIIAKKASIYANTVVSIAYKSINKAIALRNVNKIANQIIRFTTKLLYEQHILTTDLKLVYYENKISNLYQTVNFLLNKTSTLPDVPVDFPLTPPLTQESSIEGSITGFKKNDKSFFQKIFGRRNNIQVYNVSHNSTPLRLKSKSKSHKKTKCISKMIRKMVTDTNDVDDDNNEDNNNNEYNDNEYNDN